MSSFNQNLENYAELVIKNGVNVHKGQVVMIQAPISSLKFVRLLAKKAYQSGAINVLFRWTDNELTLTRYLHAPKEAFETASSWDAESLNSIVDNSGVYIGINSPNPDLLHGIGPEIIATDNKTWAQAISKFRQAIMTGTIRRTAVSVPSLEWAKKVFPHLSDEKAIEKLWDIVFKVTRASEDNPIASWDNHCHLLKNKTDKFNAKKYKKLYYKGPGTNLTIELDPNHLWISAGSMPYDGPAYIPNIPTEEMFTLPNKNGVNGTVASTMPLNYNGTLIDGISLTFENGKIIDFSAQSGFDALQRLIETDEGSHYLGEVALVPQSSPIAQTGILFYNTLYDENASCHLAIGQAYPTLEGYKTMSPEDLVNHGVNSSLLHVDFMIGSDQLNIDGETVDGKIEPIFRNGLWVI